MAVQFEERYLGDGVYASYDGWHIWLDLRGQGDPHIKIALDPDVMERLLMYRHDMAKHMKQAAERTHTDAFQSGPDERP